MVKSFVAQIIYAVENFVFKIAVVKIVGIKTFGVSTFVGSQFFGGVEVVGLCSIHSLESTALIHTRRASS